MKNIILGISTIIIEALITFGITKLIDVVFLEISIFIGFISCVIIYIFSSTGGFGSNMVRLEVQAETGLKIDEEKKTFRMSPIFLGSIFFTIFSIIGAVISYWEYFT
ncbi:hypothetical protein [Heyndrickxia sporothermodurans]|uniref:DUF3899 domain-containing protein n=1 Tax=Heyndrickxia sporothermodurans TaxID=46224 RepID=A0AB37HNR2_9BACI|nr:hypothetical protein [Heyndrickxia sporothermodurans]MBL5769074.1 hypothetical protein [Heyndrickxia sporothermodurans]MBL5772791.1 hypothetical protein [Heyndrickxia sporothermodurans]MBL5776213.1 hypothetical protein [Heyndrickxia sporothermodurans]MBL5786955.1 hypothetical protein [Heyndrickxia sporothermodurans]MBL5790496.1 hypothetical protein [Heyndrickxia sporothermodurans]